MLLLPSFVPFDTGRLPLPEKGECRIFLNAVVLRDADPVWTDTLACEQGFRPDYLALKRNGYSVSPGLDPVSGHDGALILASRSRDQNQLNLTRAWNDSKAGGVILMGGDKTSGIQSLRKWASARTGITGSLSKHHAVVFWITKQGANWPVAQQLSTNANETGGYTIAPGMFSVRGPDKGSRLLVEHFDSRISGRVADFGAGWGYLGAELQKRSQKIQRLDLYEADWASLEAAKVNIGDKVGDRVDYHWVDYHWTDLPAEAPRGPFNWVIMNPPFHAGRTAEPHLGNGFIKAAAKCLPAGGRLLMVANINLPYEKVLQGLFRKVKRLDQTNGFKVIEAVKGG